MVSQGQSSAGASRALGPTRTLLSDLVTAASRLVPHPLPTPPPASENNAASSSVGLNHSNAPETLSGAREPRTESRRPEEADRPNDLSSLGSLEEVEPLLRSIVQRCDLGLATVKSLLGDLAWKALM